MVLAVSIPDADKVLIREDFEKLTTARWVESPEVLAEEPEYDEVSQELIKRLGTILR